ncbi:MAG: ABC transporter substrate-binding protein [Eubacteriales bacterium]|nr:ABC transporter substrate-binding protein [Eubacteriales bacterium]
MKKRTMKRAVAIVVATQMVSALSGGFVHAEEYGYGEDPSLSGEINVWNWGDYEERGASKFNEYFPNIKVNFVKSESQEVLQKTITAIASGGELPDIVCMESGVRGQFMAMEDVWEVLDEAPYNVDKAELIDWAVPLCSNEAGQLLCIQVDNCVGGWAYDRQLAEKYFGISEPEELEERFKTLDDYLDAAQIVAESGGTDVMFSGGGDLYDALEGLYSANPWVTDGKLTIDKSFKPIYEYMEKMIATGTVDKLQAWTPSWNASWSEPHTIFTGCPTWYQSHVLKANDTESEGRWGLITPPGGGYSNGGTAYGIPQSIDDHQKELAWAWIKYLTMSQEGAENFYEAHTTPTLYKPAYETDLYKGEPDPFFGGQNIMAKFIEIANDPNTTARQITKYDATIDNANNEIDIKLAEGFIGAEEAYQELVDTALAAAPELTVE